MWSAAHTVASRLNGWQYWLEAPGFPAAHSLLTSQLHIAGIILHVEAISAVAFASGYRYCRQLPPHGSFGLQGFPPVSSTPAPSGPAATLEVSIRPTSVATEQAISMASPACRLPGLLSQRALHPSTVMTLVVNGECALRVAANGGVASDSCYPTTPGMRSAAKTCPPWANMEHKSQSNFSVMMP